MHRSIGTQAAVFPMPVLMVATYGADGVVDVMNMAWGGMYDDNKVILNLDPNHKTTSNLKLRRAFTLGIANASNLAAADYLGIVSGNRVPDKFARSGLTAVKCDQVDAPLVVEFPVSLICRATEFIEDAGTTHVIGEIVDVVADERILDADGKVMPEKIEAVVFDTFRHGYYALGEKLGQAWKIGAPLVKDAE